MTINTQIDRRIITSNLIGLFGPFGLKFWKEKYKFFCWAETGLMRDGKDDLIKKIQTSHRRFLLYKNWFFVLSHEALNSRYYCCVKRINKMREQNWSDTKKQTMYASHTGKLILQLSHYGVFLHMYWWISRIWTNDIA